MMATGQYIGNAVTPASMYMQQQLQTPLMMPMVDGRPVPVGLPMGGMNGIPLPPPRPEAFNSHKQLVSKKRGNSASASTFDPLDPSGNNNNQVRENLHKSKHEFAIAPTQQNI